MYQVGQDELHTRFVPEQNFGEREQNNNGLLRMNYLQLRKDSYGLIKA